MESLLHKFRSFLEALWGLSPTMVGLACITLDVAALLHLRLQTKDRRSAPAMVGPAQERGVGHLPDSIQ